MRLLERRYQTSFGAHPLPGAPPRPAPFVTGRAFFRGPCAIAIGRTVASQGFSGGVSGFGSLTNNPAAIARARYSAMQR